LALGDALAEEAFGCELFDEDACAGEVLDDEGFAEGVDGKGFVVEALRSESLEFEVLEFEVLELVVLELDALDFEVSDFELSGFELSGFEVLDGVAPDSALGGVSAAASARGVPATAKVTARPTLVSSAVVRRAEARRASSTAFPVGRIISRTDFLRSI